MLSLLLLTALSTLFAGTRGAIKLSFVISISSTTVGMMGGRLISPPCRPHPCYFGGRILKGFNRVPSRYQYQWSGHSCYMLTLSLTSGSLPYGMGGLEAGLGASPCRPHPCHHRVVIVEGFTCIPLGYKFNLLWLSGADELNFHRCG
jgi:hypothetical protein